MKCLWTITGLTIKINIESRYKNHEQVWPCNKNTMGLKDFEVAIEFNKKYINNGKPCYKLCQKHDTFAQGYVSLRHLQSCFQYGPTFTKGGHKERGIL